MNKKSALIFLPLLVLVMAVGISTCSDSNNNNDDNTDATTKIYFQSAHSPFAVYKMNGDGTSQEAIISSADLDIEQPAISPDGTKVAYIKKVSGVNQIHVSNVDGTAEQVLTTDAAGSGDPSWSIDGTKIIFARQGASGSIMTVDLSGVEAALVTSLTGVGFPSYIDANTLLYMANSGVAMRIFKYDLTTSTQTDLSSVEADSAGTLYFYTPRYSSVSGKIAFCSTKGSADGTLRELYVMNEDGTGVVKLTSRTALTPIGYDNYRPTWSPDGTEIAFFTNQKGDDDSVAGGGTTYEIYKIKADGTGETNLTNNSYADKNPSWEQ